MRDNTILARCTGPDLHTNKHTRLLSQAGNFRDFSLSRSSCLVFLCFELSREEIFMVIFRLLLSDLSPKNLNPCFSGFFFPGGDGNGGGIDRTEDGGSVRATCVHYNTIYICNTLYSVVFLSSFFARFVSIISGVQFYCRAGFFSLLRRI